MCEVTQDSIKIESRVGRVARIEITTKFRTIDVGEQQMLEIVAFDAEGNTFSSVEGMRFLWTIESDGMLENVPLKVKNFIQINIKKYKYGILKQFLCVCECV